MNSYNLPSAQIADGIWEIDEYDCSSMFLIAGEKSALLIDVGVGIGNIPLTVNNLIGELPYEVALTHVHSDHIGGADWFEEIWVNPADLDRDKISFASDTATRRQYARYIASRTNKIYPYQINDIHNWLRVPRFKSMEDGHTIDLGGRIVKTIACPGHTDGSVSFLDSKTQILFVGDCCNGLFLLNSDHVRTTAEDARAAAHALDNLRRQDFREIYNAHHDFRAFGEPLNPQTLPDLRECLRRIENGNYERIRLYDPLTKKKSYNITYGVCKVTFN